ncbi:type II toxin-antitoxin system Phd/YefM family antitoxin [Blastococcus haudaquaticus]|uniref:type II toxin-antitoxin system Phd/YefM family antitoxin n=1 Tax=Blastococcus haudaquaticus TaxID=1938745 RepID=UPI0034E291B7
MRDRPVEVPLFEARQGLGELIQRVCATGVPVYLTKRGRPVAMLAPLPAQEDESADEHPAPGS